MQHRCSKGSYVRKSEGAGRRLRRAGRCVGKQNVLVHLAACQRPALQEHSISQIAGNDGGSKIRAYKQQEQTNIHIPVHPMRAPQLASRIPKRLTLAKRCPKPSCLQHQGQKADKHASAQPCLPDMQAFPFSHGPKGTLPLAVIGVIYPQVPLPFCFAADVRDERQNGPFDLCIPLCNSSLIPALHPSRALSCRGKASFNECDAGEDKNTRAPQIVFILSCPWWSGQFCPRLGASSSSSSCGSVLRQDGGVELWVSGRWAKTAGETNGETAKLQNCRPLSRAT